jgi:hypothetical protein
MQDKHACTKINIKYYSYKYNKGVAYSMRDEDCITRLPLNTFCFQMSKKLLWETKLRGVSKSSQNLNFVRERL